MAYFYFLYCKCFLALFVLQLKGGIYAQCIRFLAQAGMAYRLSDRLFLFFVLQMFFSVVRSAIEGGNLCTMQTVNTSDSFYFVLQVFFNVVRPAIEGGNLSTNAQCRLSTLISILKEQIFRLFCH
jgi:hypothetical protein